MSGAADSATQAAALSGHFDRRHRLEYLLEHHAPSTPEGVTRKEYDAWTETRRAKFDAQRSARVASRIVILTPQLEEIAREVKRAVIYSSRDIGRTGVIVDGPPAMGKTTAAFHGMVRAFRDHTAKYPDWRQLGHIPVVYVEVPMDSNAKVIMGRFLRFLGIPFTDKMTLETRTQAVTDHLQRARPSLIVIDEMQNLSRLSNGSLHSAQALKNLLNAVQAAPMYVGWNLRRLLAIDDLGAQFAARSTRLAMERPGYSSTAEKNYWTGLVRAFETQVALLDHPAGTLDPHSSYLWHRTGGSIGALSRVLTAAALDLIGKGPGSEERITVEQLELIKLDDKTEQEYERLQKLNAPSRGKRRAA